MTAWLWQPHVAVLFIGTIISLLSAFMAWLRRSNPVARYLIRLMLAISVWIFGSMVEAGVTAFADKLFWTQFQYLGLIAVPPYLLLFVLSYTRREYIITGALRWSLLAAAVFTQLALMTNPWHGQFYTGFAESPEAVNVLVYYHGPLYYLSQIILYTEIGAALLILFHDMVFARPPYRTQLLMLQLSIILPALIGVLYTLRMTPLIGLDWTPLVGAASSLLLVWNFYQFKLLTIVPVAYQAVFTNVRKAIFVLNHDRQILDLNPAAEQLIGRTAAQAIGTVWTATWQTLQQHGQLLHDPSTDDLLTLQESEFRLDNGTTTAYFQITVYPFVDPSLKTDGHLIVFQDITARKLVEAELRELNTNLEQKVLEQTADLRAAQERLAGQLSEQSRKLAGLYDVILMSGNVQHDTPELLDRALAKVRAIIDCDQLIFLQLKDEELLPRAGCCRDGTAPLELPTLPSAWLTAAAQGAVINNLTQEPSAPPALRSSGYQTCLVRWMSSTQDHAGVLLSLWRQQQPISVEDIALFGALTDELNLILEIEQRRREATRFAVIEERHRLARDLHDSITQSLHSLMLTAENARSVAHSDPQRLDQFLLHLLSSARHALTETRLLLFELRPQLRQNQSLIDMLQVRLEAVERRVGIEAEVTLEGATAWPAAWEHDLYSLILEALNNALKHAQASHISIAIRSTPAAFNLTVSDNGRGFVPSRNSRGGMGMITMADRARQLGGVLRIESTPGYGTRIELVITRDSSDSAELPVPTTSSAAEV